MSQYFDVKVDGASIYDLADKNKTLINPVVKTGIEEAGSFDFTIDPSSPYYDSITPYASDIEVFEDGESIFFGRALPPSTNIFDQKTYHCEGALAFLNDVILPPMPQFVLLESGFTSGDGDAEFTGGQDEFTSDVSGYQQRTVNLSEYLAYVFREYDIAQVKPNRKLTCTGTTVDTAMLYNSGYKSCMDVLRQEILPYIGGYMIARRAGGSTYVDIKTGFPEGGQPITAGANLLDFMANGQRFYTACIARGGKVKDAETGEQVDVAMSDPVFLPAAGTYGTICAYKEFPQCLTVQALRDACMDFLSGQQFNEVLFEADAIDLHILNREYPALRIGQSVSFVSPSHGINASVVVSALEAHLDTGEKRVSLGTRKRATLTNSLAMQFSKKEDREANKVVKPYDLVPTENSTNPVTSGGIYDALQNYVPSGGTPAGDGWIHQVDGATRTTGIINFITT